MTAVDDRPVVVDEKAGWSTPCRAGNFDTCVSLGYRCRNPRHKSEGETPAQRRERLIAEARARRTGDTTPAPASPPPPAAQPPERRRRKPVEEMRFDPPADDDLDLPDDDSSPRVRRPRLSANRLMVLRAVHDAGGIVVNDQGRASAAVLDLCPEYSSGVPAFAQVLVKLAADGLLERGTRGTNTYWVATTAAGEQLLADVTGIEPGPVAPRPELRKRPTSRPRASTPKPPTNPTTPAGPVALVWEAPYGTSDAPPSSLVNVLAGAGALDALRDRPGAWARLVADGLDGFEIYARCTGVEGGRA